jgi:hypothetical protein
MLSIEQKKANSLLLSGSVVLPDDTTLPGLRSKFLPQHSNLGFNKVHFCCFTCVTVLASVLTTSGMSVTEKLSAEEIAEFREIFSLVDKVSIAAFAL